MLTMKRQIKVAAVAVLTLSVFLTGCARKSFVVKTVDEKVAPIDKKVTDLSATVKDNGNASMPLTAEQLRALLPPLLQLQRQIPPQELPRRQRIRQTPPQEPLRRRLPRRILLRPPRTRV